MMKKMIVWIVIFMLAFSLGGCGDDGEMEEQQTEEKFVDTEGSVYSILVKINPEFEIFVNENSIITAVKCLNEDAKKALAKMDVTNEAFEVGFRKLLDTVYENGYMNENGTQISVAMYRAAVTDMDESILVDGFYKVIDEFCDDTKIGLGVEMGDTVIVGSANAETVVQQNEQQNEQQVAQEEVSENDDEQFTEVERDEAGNLIRTLEGERGNGGIESFYINGVLNSSKVENADGSYTQYTYHVNGQIATEKHKSADGHMAEFSYDEKGNCLYSKIVEVDGNIFETTYDSNGNVTSEVIESNGTHEERYYADGVLTLAKTKTSEGIYIEIHYHANGQAATINEEHADGSKHEKICDENGNCTYSNTIHADGSTREITYYPDGSEAALIITKPDGAYLEERYYESGSMSYFHQIQADQSYIERSYDEKGNVTSDVRRENFLDGSYAIRTYRGDGTLAYEYAYAIDGTIWYNEFDANGNQILEAQKQIQ